MPPLRALLATWLLAGAVLGAGCHPRLSHAKPAATRGPDRPDAGPPEPAR